MLFSLVQCSAAVQECIGTALTQCNCAALQECISAALKQCNRAAVQECISTSVKPCSSATVQCRSATVHQYTSAAVHQCISAAVKKCSSTAVQQWNSSSVQPLQCSSVAVQPFSAAVQGSAVIPRTLYPHLTVKEMLEMCVEVGGYSEEYLWKILCPKQKTAIFSNQGVKRPQLMKLPRTEEEIQGMTKAEVGLTFSLSLICMTHLSVTLLRQCP